MPRQLSQKAAPPHQKKKNSTEVRVKPAKTCRVCGGVAQSFNFNGMSCESCKTFFRRNAHRHDNFVCFNSELCDINVLNRRFCKRCRLNKCFAIGMRKELIKTTNTLDQSSTSSSDSLSPSYISPDGGIGHTLTSYESACLRSITAISEIFHEKPLHQITIIGYATNLMQVFRMQEFFIHSVIKMADSMEGFADLKRSERVAILQEAFPKIMLLRSAFFFNFEKNAFLVRVDPECNTAVMVSLEMFYGPSLNFFIAMHRELAYLIYELVERDTIIRDFIAILILFQPRPNLTCQEYLHYNFAKYCHLLKKYLTYKYRSSTKGEEHLDKLMQIIEDVGPLKKMIVEIFDNLDFNRGPVSQALATIYGFN